MAAWIRKCGSGNPWDTQLPVLARAGRSEPRGGRGNVRHTGGGPDGLDKRRDARSDGGRWRRHVVAVDRVLRRGRFWHAITSFKTVGLARHAVAVDAWPSSNTSAAPGT